MAWRLWSEVREGQPVQFDRGPEIDRVPTSCVFSGDSCWAEELDAEGNVSRVYVWQGDPKKFDRRGVTGPKTRGAKALSA